MPTSHTSREQLWTEATIMESRANVDKPCGKETIVVSHYRRRGADVDKLRCKKMIAVKATIVGMLAWTTYMARRRLWTEVAG